MSHSPKFTAALVAAVTVRGETDVGVLATVAHCHGHRSLARLFSRMQARNRESDTPLQKRVTIVRDASSAAGARSLLNAYGITQETRLNLNQTIFLYCHRLGLPFARRRMLVGEPRSRPERSPPVGRREHCNWPPHCKTGCESRKV